MTARRGAYETRRPQTMLGRCFVHPVFDYALIGGGLSLIVTPIAVLYPGYTDAIGLTTLAYLILFSNSAHFAASTVRLYTKPGAVVLDPVGAFTLATIFHGIQYLAIAGIFHAREQSAQEGNRLSVRQHGLWFYGASLLLGYGLFYCLPWAFTSLGFGLLESVALVVAAINVHHFIVDAFIWRLRPGDANRRIVETGRALAA